MLTLLVGLAACQRGIGTGVHGRPAAEQASASPSPDPRIDVSVVPANASRSVRPDLPVTVTTTAGRLTGIRVASTAGTVVPGGVSTDGLRWVSTGRLAFDSSYVVSGRAVDQHQHAKQIRSTFTTLSPDRTTFPSVTPLNGETVGVGMPIIIYWSRRVPDRAAAERLLTVTSDKPIAGAWHWFSNSEVHFRPKVYWPAYSHVTVNISVGNALLGSGVYGEQSRQIRFNIGSSVVSRITNATKSMTVYKDGHALRTMPVSLGRSSMPTSAGTHLVVEKFTEKYFDSATFGLPRDAPGGYYTKVYWDTKFTYGGEYIHAAPWSLAQQGHRNVSHGCVNVSPSNAEWFYYLSKRGDVVQVVGTERAVRPGDGLTDWNVSWTSWLAGSALPHA